MRVHSLKAVDAACPLPGEDTLDSGRNSNCMEEALFTPRERNSTKTVEVGLPILILFFEKKMTRRSILGHVVPKNLSLLFSALPKLQSPHGKNPQNHL